MTFELASMRYLLSVEPNNLQSQSQLKVRASLPADAQKRRSAEMISDKERVLRPNVQL